VLSDLTRIEKCMHQETKASGRTIGLKTRGLCAAAGGSRWEKFDVAAVQMRNHQGRPNQESARRQ